MAVDRTKASLSEVTKTAEEDGLSARGVSPVASRSTNRRLEDKGALKEALDSSRPGGPTVPGRIAKDTSEISIELMTTHPTSRAPNSILIQPLKLY